MGYWVKFYVDVDEFSKYKDKWARASKWMKEKFGITRKSSWDYRRDYDQYCYCEVLMNADGSINSSGYWSRCYNVSKERAEGNMRNDPKHHIQVYYNNDNIFYGEM